MGWKCLISLLLPPYDDEACRAILILTVSKRRKNNCTKDEVTEVVYLPEEETYFSDETIKSLTELGNVIEPILRRLEAEGYVMIGGKIVKSPVIEI